MDISETFERKIDALSLHESQASAFVGGLRARMTQRAKDMGAPSGLEMAEAFTFAWLD